jgi:hypothetical protein
VAILIQMRGTNPSQARAWLSTVWKREKAELRHDLLESLATNLSSEDEPFLESALDDRSEKVRTGAASLLARLPQSALAGRMRARAEAMLAYEPEGRGGRLGRTTRALHHTSAGAKLVITLPGDLESDWIRDGIVATPAGVSQEIGGRAWWMQQVLGLIPPDHWAEQFDCAPDALIAAAMRTEWSMQIVEAWSRAALLHHDATWAGPLWDWWLDTASRSARGRDATQRHMLQALLALLPPAEAERRILPLLNGDAQFGKATEPHDPFWRTLITALPAPWSEAFSAACLDGLYRFIAAGPAGHVLAGSIWFHHLDAVSIGIAPTLLPRELMRWQAPDLVAELPSRDSRRDPAAQRWAETLAHFVETLRLRHRVYRELSQG